MENLVLEELAKSMYEPCHEWKSTRKSSVVTRAMSVNGANNSKRWQPPEPGELKLNVDASFYPGHESFSVGMVLRDQEGTFLEGKCISLPQPATVMEAECIGVREALSWIIEQSENKVTLESDLLLVCRALMGGTMNLLKVGHIQE